MLLLHPYLLHLHVPFALHCMLSYIRFSNSISWQCSYFTRTCFTCNFTKVGVSSHSTYRPLYLHMLHLHVVFRFSNSISWWPQPQRACFTCYLLNLSMSSIPRSPNSLASPAATSEQSVSALQLRVVKRTRSILSKLMQMGTSAAVPLLEATMENKALEHSCHGLTSDCWSNGHDCPYNLQNRLDG